MASNISLAMRRVASSHARFSIRRIPRSSRCLYSTETDSPPPPLLSKLKTDLKTAMRAKDASRLTVLRTILAATTNASKTSKPIQTDQQLIALMRKTAKGNQEALNEAKAANRQDLVDKEDAQLQIINEYIAGAGVKVLEEDELKTIVEDFIRQAEGKSKGEITRELMSRDWVAEGKVVDKGQLAKILNDALPKK